MRFEQHDRHRFNRRGLATLGIIFIALAPFLFLIVNADPTSKPDDRAIVGIISCFFLAFGIPLLALSFKLPTADIIRLAQSRRGLLTLTDIVTSLDISPARALRALKQLQKTGIASQRWQDFRKNTWEFPDFLDTPGPLDPATPTPSILEPPAHLPPSPAPPSPLSSFPSPIADTSPPIPTPTPRPLATPQS